MKLLEDINYYLQGYLNQHLNFKSKKNGLYSGVSGIILYNSFLSYYSQNKKFITERQLNTIVSNLLTDDILSPEFSDGISGKLWVLNNLIKNNLIETGPIGESLTFKEYLFEELMVLAKQKNWDNIHGAFGILYYLIDHHLLDTAKLDKFILELSKGMYENSHFVFYKTGKTKENPQEFFNLSLSHGISGHILILTKILRQFPANESLKRILDNMVSFLLQFKISNSHGGYFPHIVDQTKKKLAFNSTRLSWCYGDLGPGLALYRYSTFSHQKDIRELSLQILLHCAFARDMNENKVFDAQLCHGTSGLMHIFNRLYQETNLTEFKTASDYWLSKTLEFYKRKGIEGFASLRYDQVPKYVLLPYLLSGLAGIGLALLSKISTEKEPKWDGCLFLN